MDWSNIIGKAPAFQFYPSDWSRDLEEHPLEIEGAWIRICCKLWWAEDRGKLSKTLIQWARILSINKEKTEEILKYIKNEKIGEVSFENPKPNGNITIISRRMRRDEKDRENNRIRQQRFYKKGKPNGDLTATSQDSSSSPLKKKKYIKKSRKFKQEEFDSFYQAYPMKKGKDKALDNWKKKLKDNKLPPLEELLNAIEKQKEEKESKRANGKFASEWSMPQVWIKDGRWKDEVEKIERWD